MNKNLIPKKLISISEFKIPNLKIRRLFILINGSRTLSELATLCHIDFEECEKIIAELIKNKSIEIEGFNFEHDSETTEIDEEVLLECKGFYDCISKELALYIGPVAKMLVDKTDATKSALTINRMYEIVEEIAKEIDNLDDRMVFIETMKDRISTNKG